MKKTQPSKEKHAYEGLALDLAPVVHATFSAIAAHQCGTPETNLCDGVEKIALWYRQVVLRQNIVKRDQSVAFPSRCDCKSARHAPCIKGDTIEKTTPNLDSPCNCLLSMHLVEQPAPFFPPHFSKLSLDVAEYLSFYNRNAREF